MQKLVTIAGFGNLTEAAIVQGNLEAAGFDAVIQNPNSGSIPEIMGDFLTGVTVQVPEDQFEAARQYLEEAEILPETDNPDAH